MSQVKIGIFLFFVLALPPVTNLLESIMIIHMHMQMPLLIISGFLIAPIFQKMFPLFFSKWNENGTPGILLFVLIMIYWMIPRTMDDALTSDIVQLFKFISLTFLAGVPLRDSWKKITNKIKTFIIIFFTITFYAMGIVYISWPDQLCNNYLIIEQITLGWGFITMAICSTIYLSYTAIINPAEYE
ncbi:hypothetical protein [Evansella cellulosilytica]|uniref:Uncharacterized protein n=1 Tax=Evansella cellulosilytica (strain ATCC 21833 / DSM 2522 / FERM P-1141 / JCM 9156 / N-4) TaxID=649639 RepID=E6TR68_EVAC2|nr:hypothetical protein [Evansella cellulosilytica]ADU30580.1 hypothetical protein Bcell_2320 [Evansella cellulosilytica DSM 2522]